ncbi:two-component system regulatory protein YycI [Tepidimicrobium xylanilyticum]|uniref:Two-component signal transduction system YycFG, regulatory protein YycI n=1 Tax=Tepidimicrobium xylanilyticum TaxID=1123352 RepID=A0A1H3AKT1_9FIRM|nr:hypothetical protein [Tepidimicrobium xylanilyticum]GMG98092.1 hypothetical protein EN5CB1_29180 [Tepidimicrobium xylanilyticum]SDX30320.1 Two-component signal transduction system YycFG, regulatory protein YycI [Tepidimicrobium xylanilyticum]
MDWSKAKTILIVAFIITNLLLVYVLIGEYHIDEPTLKKEFINEVIELLKEKDIGVATEMPMEIPRLNSMIVEYENVNIQRLNLNYFNNKGIIEQSSEGLSKVVRGGESFLLINNRSIIYENSIDDKIYSDLDEDKAIELAEEFIKKGKFNTDDMKLSFIKEDKGTFYIEYSKIYEDVYVEKAFTNFQIDKRGVKRFERSWLKEKDLADVEIYISTAPKSILALLGMQQVYGKTITDISLCYYFEPEKHDYLEKPTEAKQGKAVPAWRIQFDDGYKIFIDEY